MFERSENMMDFTYDPGLVALSIAVAILGSFTGLVLTSGIRRVRGLEATLRLVLGAVGIGGGVWSMHFIAMLAVQLPIPLSYDIPVTLISAVAAVIFTAGAVWTVAYEKLGRASLPISAIVLGLGIATMHYLGMSAIRGCGLAYSKLGVAISVLIAIQAAGVALWFAFHKRGVLDTLLGSVALGLAIASMHYSGMEATRFVRGGTPFNLAEVLSEPLLAVAIATTLYTVCSVCLIVYAILTFAKPMRYN
jgi:NO-binding membrane sensor protein with MHYT domain